MPELFQTLRRVQFHQTDAAGIIHFSAFVTWMEEAEHELLRQCGLSVLFRDEQGSISWPRVALGCEFQRPVRFEDEVAVEVSVARLGSSSVTYRFTFRHGGEILARGTMTSVCCRLSEQGPPRKIEIPESFRTALQPYVLPLE